MSALTWAFITSQAQWESPCPVWHCITHISSWMLGQSQPWAFWAPWPNLVALLCWGDLPVLPQLPVSRKAGSTELASVSLPITNLFWIYPWFLQVQMTGKLNILAPADACRSSSVWGALKLACRRQLPVLEYTKLKGWSSKEVAPWLGKILRHNLDFMFKFILFRKTPKHVFICKWII